MLLLLRSSNKIGKRCTEKKLSVSMESDMCKEKLELNIWTNTKWCRTFKRQQCSRRWLDKFTPVMAQVTWCSPSTACVVGHLSSHRRGVILSPGDLSTPPVSRFLIVHLNYMIFIYTECTPTWLPVLIVSFFLLQAHLFTIPKNLILILMGLSSYCIGYVK